MHSKRIATIHRLSVTLLSTLLTGAISLSAAPAMAVDAKAEKDVKELQRKAIEEDNLATDYDAAIKKLQWALTRCGADKCSPAVRGAIYRDLGAMQLLNKKTEEGKSSFLEALKLDPSLNLDPSYKSPALQSVWDEVSKKASTATSTPGPAVKAEPAAQPAVETQSTELTHTPATEQQKHAPVPVYVEYSGEGVAKVTAKYRAGSSGEFKSLDLQKMGKGWGGLIPCEATTGDHVQYYVVARNSANESIATAGKKKEPLSVALKSEPVADAPHLPGREPPPVCGGDATEAAPAASDCPPGLPGCDSKKAEGEECDGDSECKSNACTTGKCAAGTAGKSQGEDCESDNECSSNSCNANKCTGGSSGKFKRVWLGVSVGFEDNFVAGTQNACNTNEYICLPTSGVTSSTPPIISTNPSDKSPINGAVAFGAVRVMGSFDYAVTRNFMLGTRLGYAGPTYNGPSAKQVFQAPLHVEARATYVLGKGVEGAGIAPLFVVGGGVSQFASVVKTGLTQSTGAQNVNAWYVGGGGFIHGGGGLRYGLSESVALVGLAQLGYAIGGQSGGFLYFDPELGIQVGF